jgi:hypothetical protein
MLSLTFSEGFMRRLLTSLFVSTMLICGPALALERPALPATAVKLDAAGLIKLYSDMRANYNNLQNDVTLTGEIFYNPKNKTMLGTYVWDNKDKGIFKGKLRLKGDKFCNTPDKGKETCSDVYLDGKTYYEIDAKGQVSNVDTILDSTPEIPKNAKPLKAVEVLALVKGKRIFVWLYDIGTPLVADVKWDLKKKASIGKFIISGTKEGKANAKYKVKGDQICFPDDSGENCFNYFAVDNGFIEINSKGKLHGWSSFQ